MNKIFFSHIFLIILALVLPQPPPSNPSIDEPDTKPAPPFLASLTGGTISSFAVVEDNADWECTVKFSSAGRTYYTEFMDKDEPYTFRRMFSPGRDNKIDRFFWYGSQCLCWVVVYEDADYGGENLGFFIYDRDLSEEEAGFFDLNMFLTWDTSADVIGWDIWNTIVSSYAIYCSRYE